MSKGLNVPEGLWKKAEVVSWIKCGVSTVEHMTSKKQIPHIKIGRSVFYDPADLRAWIESKKIASSAGAPV